MPNYDGTAIDPSVFDEGQLEAEPVNSAVEVVDEGMETAANEPEAVEAGTPTPTSEKISVPGLGEFTAEEIREFKQGYLRQSDYTKKTQELAARREALNDAEALYNHLRDNPQLVEALRQAEQNPNAPQFTQAPSVERQMMQQIMYNQKAMEVDMKLNELKQKYGDIDEVALFNKASELRTDDLEFVYKAMAYDKGNVDMAAAVAQAKAELKAELESNRQNLTTVADKGKPAPPVSPVQLTPDEKRVAINLGLSDDEYFKWKS